MCLYVEMNIQIVLTILIECVLLVIYNSVMEEVYENTRLQDKYYLPNSNKCF